MKKSSELLNGLNEQQTSAVTHTEGPLLIVAGAGTGKTTVVARRIAWLIERRFAKPHEILALTFTEKAAGEMEERIDRLLPYGYLDVWISTFHAFGQKILERHALDVGLPVNFKLFTATESWLLLRRNLEKFELDYYRPLGSPARFFHALIRHFSRAKDELVTPAEYSDYAKNLTLNLDSEHKGAGSEQASEAARVSEIAAAYGVYQRLLLERGALDFGDLINYTHALFKKRPAILARYQKQFKYILVDEFQDTNYAQFELVRQLASPKNNLTVVGDDDQSIYKFRGASVSNILKFRENYPKAAQVSLTQNYRSRQNLLDIAYQFIQGNNPERLETKLAINKRLAASRSGEADIELRKYQDFHHEALGVVKKIAEIKSGDPTVLWSDFAVLLRANDSAEIFTETLERAGVPCQQLSRRGLYRKPVILDVLAYFRLLDNYHESRAMFRVMNFPVFSFSHDDVAALTDFAGRKACSIYEALKSPALQKFLSEAGRESASRLLSVVEKHTAYGREHPVNEVFVKIAGDLKMAAAARTEGGRIADAGYLDQFYRKIQNFAATEDSRGLKDFMEVLEMEIASGEQGNLDFDLDIGPDAVKIITVHSAKGLEFRYVFLPGLVDKRFPVISRGEPIELPEPLVRDILPQGDVHIQEERRLFYVAMTRARDGLYFSFASDYGGSSVRKPSIFLKELGGNLKTETAPAPYSPMPVFEPPAGAQSKLALPKTHSFTSLSAFKKCALEYKYTYLLKIPRPGSAALSFGRTIHRTLENYLKLYQQSLQNPQGELFFVGAKSAASANLPPFKKLEEFYREAWVDDWFTDKIQKGEYNERGLKILTQVFKHFEQDPPQPKYIEQKFKFSLGEYVFTGKLDRADQADKALRVIDYKTGIARQKLEKVDKEQLFIYQIAAQESLHERVSALEYWYFNNRVEILKSLGTEADLENAKAELTETLDRIAEAVSRDSFAEIHQKQKKHHCEFEDLT